MSCGGVGAGLPAGRQQATAPITGFLGLHVGHPASPGPATATVLSTGCLSHFKIFLNETALLAHMTRAGPQHPQDPGLRSASQGKMRRERGGRPLGDGAGGRGGGWEREYLLKQQGYHPLGGCAKDLGAHGRFPIKLALASVVGRRLGGALRDPRRRLQRLPGRRPSVGRGR